MWPDLELIGLYPLRFSGLYFTGKGLFHFSIAGDPYVTFGLIGEGGESKEDNIANRLTECDMDKGRGKDVPRIKWTSFMDGLTSWGISATTQ